MRLNVALCLFSLLLASGANAQNLPPDNTFDVIIDSQSPTLRSSTACSSYTGGTTYDVWDSAPAEVLTTPLLWLVRFVRIHNVTESATPYTTGYVAARIGPSTNAVALTLATGERIMGGDRVQYNVRRPNSGSTNAGTWPAGPQPIWVLPQSTVTLCVTYYW